MIQRLSPSLKQRILFLLGGNFLLLIVIALALKKGASFSEVLWQAGPNITPIVLAAIGLTGIIYTGAIDLSIASVIAVAGSVFGILALRGMPPWICFTSVVLTCAFLLWGNGLLVRKLKLPALIITLGGLAYYRGVALIVADLWVPHFGGNIMIEDQVFHAPGKLFSPWFLLGGVSFAFLLEAFGKQPRQWLALGNSEEACRLAGLSPGKILQNAFLVGGFFLGLAALVFVTRIQIIEPSRLALGFELQIIGAIVLGGTNIFGGEGSYIGTVLGAVFLYLTGQALTYCGVSPFLQEVVTGAFILGVIGLDCYLHRKQKWMEELA